jgi:ADP-heptose:LPS heptosyltransferase
MSRLLSRANVANPRRILIFLLGSLGDTVVALPALHLIARRFPDAERRVLTHGGISSKAAAMSDLLAGSGLVHDYFKFPAGMRGSRGPLKLANEIRRWGPDLVVHLHEPRGMRAAVRDWFFFKLCGARHTIGLPLGRDDRTPHYLPDLGRFEHRSEQLTRRLASLGDAALGDLSSWSLGLTDKESTLATAALAPLSGSAGILAISLGTKLEVNRWDDERWKGMLASAGARLRGWGVVALGAAAEAEATQRILEAWPGPRLNLCGQLPVRQSAAILACSRVFVGHDSGPLHLAASVGTPCVGVYSARNPPGRWYPYGNQHRVIQRHPPCANCGLTDCIEKAKQCIVDITSEEVAIAVVDAAARSGTSVQQIRNPPPSSCRDGAPAA